MDIDSKIILRTGNPMPIFGLGTWKLDKDTVATVSKALLLGYPMIDTSGDYGTQPAVGEGIRNSRIPRRMIYVVTKVEEDEDSFQATIKNLKELQLDYVDLMLIHRPPESSAGIDLWRGLIQVKNEGLAKDIGVSNYSIDQIEELIASTSEVPVVNQIEWSPFGHRPEMLEYCQDKNIALQAYSPLTRAERLDDDTLRDIAMQYDKTPAQILARWNIQLGTVPIIKANKIEHLEEDMDIFDFEISADDMATLNSLNEEYSALGPSLQYV
ncbi:MAG TPA: aldo/keto reductase [Patescibacteria group bacterium]|nr:aldo/keto reductase [Patescibacteria group bacterium]